VTIGARVISLQLERLGTVVGVRRDGVLMVAFDDVTGTGRECLNPLPMDPHDVDLCWPLGAA
jgi:hypothetical protein